mmetsp:Transcript_68679/g.100567  ORF Transcript_68679/g.100567 Transcript_68679/m.100567 type:complete len:230 (-) Transcript_68679:64-753(-)
MISCGRAGTCSGRCNTSNTLQHLQDTAAPSTHCNLSLAAVQRLLQRLVVWLVVELRLVDALRNTLMQHTAELRANFIIGLLVVGVLSPHSNAVLFGAQRAHGAAYLVLIWVLLAHHRHHCIHPQIINRRRCDTPYSLFIVCPFPPLGIKRILPHRQDAFAEQMVVATDRELGRCGHVVHGSPKLFNRLKLAQALHILRPVLHPAALAALERAVKPQDPLSLQVVRTIIK